MSFTGSARSTLLARASTSAARIAPLVPRFHVAAALHPPTWPSRLAIRHFSDHRPLLPPSTPRTPLVKLEGSSPYSRLLVRFRSSEAAADKVPTAAAATPIEPAAAEEPKEPKEKIQMGEVRRLMVLAKPERKTIAIAMGLVSVEVLVGNYDRS